jgi:GntR family transcriptional regulator
MDAGRIDHGSAVPLYRQLAAILRDQIIRGQLTGALPPEAGLAGEYEVAVGTLRKALAVLRDEGLLRTYPGRGSEVVPP